MQDQYALFEDLKKLVEENPQGINIIEEQIDISIQNSYQRRATMLRRQVFTLEDVFSRLPILYDAESRFEEKRDILVQLASFADVEAFRAIEDFKNNSEGEIKLWATMAYQESKATVEGSLLESPQVLISTGLGGKGFKLRYFVCFVKKDKEAFSPLQERMIRGELENAADLYQAEIESEAIANHLIKFFLLIPLYTPPTEIVEQVIKACDACEQFLDRTTIISNVKELDDAEINEIIDRNLLEEEGNGIEMEILNPENIKEDEFLDDDEEDDDDDDELF